MVADNRGTQLIRTQAPGQVCWTCQRLHYMRPTTAGRRFEIWRRLLGSIIKTRLRNMGHECDVI